MTLRGDLGWLAAHCLHAWRLQAPAPHPVRRDNGPFSSSKSCYIAINSLYMASIACI